MELTIENLQIEVEPQESKEGKVDYVEVTFKKCVRIRSYPRSVDSIDIYYDDIGWVLFDISFTGDKRFQLIASIDYDEDADKKDFSKLCDFYFD